MIIGLILILLVVGLDQATKYTAQHFLAASGEKVVIIKGVLEFEYFQNSGAAWGILEGRTLIFFIITIIALIGFGYLFTKSSFKRKKVYSISIALLIGGTFGNAIDRMLLKYVIDFLHVPFLTPILNAVGLSNFWFNIADLALTVGIIMLAIDMIFLESRRSRERDQSVYERLDNQRNNES